MTSEQLEAARAERMRQNGLGTLTLEEARTWIEETGLCLFLPRRQFLSSVAPSFVEAVSGQGNPTPDQKQIALAEELLVRLEIDGVAVRLNLLGQPGEQPDFVVAAWVLPYVYALRGDRDWRRSPQLTGSRAVSQLAVLAYKLLESGDLTIPQLKQVLGREVTEAAVLRAITELWQQLRIIPVISAPGHTAKWQLLRIRYQKAIAEGASTSQVTAISVLASIYLQAVIAASMEEVEIFLSPLTARSKVREVLRGLLATRQVHTIAMGHAPHFYVAGTLPEFAPATGVYPGAYVSSSSYVSRPREFEQAFSPAPALEKKPLAPPTQAEEVSSLQAEASPARPLRPPAAVAKSPVRLHFSRPVAHARDHKPAAPARHGQKAPVGRTARRADARPSSNRTNGVSRPGSGPRWAQNGAQHATGKSNGNHASSSNGTRLKGASHAPSNGNGASRNGKASSWSKSAAARSNGHSNGLKNGSKPGSAKRVVSRSRADARPVHKGRKPALTAGATARSGNKYGFTARPKQGKKKRG
ncbi:MAG TPA: hypothetical protein VMU48_05470 [Terracidiphilus sp.]|nr:hypothetical protein [Terracidiphilus sp.]